MPAPSIDLNAGQAVRVSVLRSTLAGGLLVPPCGWASTGWFGSPAYVVTANGACARTPGPPAFSVFVTQKGVVNLFERVIACDSFPAPTERQHPKIRYPMQSEEERKKRSALMQTVGVCVAVEIVLLLLMHVVFGSLSVAAFTSVFVFGPASLWFAAPLCRYFLRANQ